jgi:hypothetical protein
MTMPEWLPESYLLQIKYSHCCSCNKDHTSSELWQSTPLSEERCNAPNSAHFITRAFAVAPLPAASSSTCHECFTDYTPFISPDDLGNATPRQAVLGNNYRASLGTLNE